MKRYNCIKQKELKDCGCACLATICKTYHTNIPIYKIREIAKTDKMGTSAMGLINAGEELGFSCKAFRAEKPKQIYSEIPLPAIAHVVIDKMYEHYIVIHKITEKYILVADPGKGIVKYSPQDFFEIWTGIIITFTKKAEFKSMKKEDGLLKKFFELVKPQRGLLINIFLSSILITIFGIVGSFYFKFLLNTVIPNDLKSTLNMFSIGLIVLTVFSVLTSAFRRQLLIHFSQKNGAIKNIDVKNVQYVTKGQTLLTLDVKNANEQLQELKTQNKNLENNIKGLTNLSNSINDASNYLNSESKYYAQYQSYLSQNNILNSEVNFRAAILGSLRKHINIIAAIIILAIIFSLMHGNLLQSAYTFPLGIVLGLAFIYGGSIFVDISCHMTFNLLGIFILPILSYFYFNTIIYSVLAIMFLGLSLLAYIKIKNN